MNFVSLFAGIGGFDLGLERAGMSCAAQVEIDAKCQAVQAAHFQAAQRWNDVRTVGASNLPATDLICGGFPCQDLSVAGQRAGLAGERSGLWFEYRRILDELRPQWVVIENVPGLLSSQHGRDFAIVLRGLVELGYGVCWRILDAQYFGVAQRRRRVFIVGSLGDGRAAEVLFERESGHGDTAPRREAGQDVTEIAGTLSANAGGTNRPAGNANELDFCVVANPLGAHHARQDLDNDTYIAFDTQQITSKANRTRVEPGLPTSTLNQAGQMHVARAQSARQSRLADDADNFVTHTLRAEGHDASEDGTGLGVPMVYGLLGETTPKVSENIMPTLRSAKDGSGEQHQFIGGGMGVRRLTPVECERLQGFPDGWTAGQADSTRYRQLGNAVCVPVAHWIGRRIMALPA